MKHFKPPKPKSTPKPKAKKSKAKKSKTSSSETEKPTETPVASKAADAEPETEEQLDPEAQSEQQREDIKNNGPNVQSHGGRGPTEEELREALKKAGVEWDDSQIKDYVGKQKHDEL